MLLRTGEADTVKCCESDSSADLGESSNESNEKFDD